MEKFKLILSREEINTLRNGIEFILMAYKDELSPSSLESYQNVKVRLDMEFNRQVKK